MKVVAIIQARMGSTRLAGKVLMNIAGKPMLWHVVSRLNYSKLINKIIIATSANKSDDPIEAFCDRYRVDYLRGSEEDVLDRYYQAARAYQADPIVRITADCPLIDPEVTDKTISGYVNNAEIFNGASNTIHRTYPRGLDTEVMSFSALGACWEKANRDYQREHVTAYIYEHPDLFKMYSVENNVDLSHLRWTVDEGVDMDFVREIYGRLYKENDIFLMNEVLDILEREPTLKEINRHVKQKAVIR